MVEASSSTRPGGVTAVAASGRAGLWGGILLDLETAGRAFPLGRLVIPLVALALGLGIGWFRPGYVSIYGESLAVIVVFVAIGSFGRTIGALAVVAFGIADVAHFLLIADPTIGAQVSRGTLVGRIVAPGVLWLVAVLVPSVGRRAEWIVEDRAGDGGLGRLVGAAAGAVAAAGGAYLWANVMPYLIRPAFTYSPPPQTLQPQQHPAELAIAAAVVFALASVALRRRAVDQVELDPLLEPPASPPAALVYRVVAYAVLTVLVWGIVSGPADVAVLAAGFLVGEVGAWLAARPTASRALAHLPPLLLAVAGLALSAAVAVAIGGLGGGLWPKGLGDSVFFPIVLAIAVAFPIARIGFSLAASRRVQVPPIPFGAAVVGAVGIVALAGLTFPQVALADNCANLGDCGFFALFMLTVFGFGFFFAAAAYALSRRALKSYMHWKTEQYYNIRYERAVSGVRG